MSVVFLVGVDCSACGERALDYAAERAKARDGRLVVAHIIEWSPYSFNTPQDNEERHRRREEEIRSARAEIIDPITQRLRAEGVEAEGVVRHGHAADTLAALAEECGATNIVVGHHGMSRLRARVFGSVASTLVQIADRPVTVVP
ncbi:MAG: universal stress protein [Xanthomonadales bacterium]|nr:universal stress protein [Xanthomonadales bacterium]NIN60638.1 universal stress protein [Xanthomonadales bacterium]NIN75990.1 universal stress protein [Xanthomonadales bacterium]NIO13043.1 universal stress protein [Xanthomonadales bacterium]NIP13031.1 universal stress protein [Xanthomonadales bacterium]